MGNRYRGFELRFHTENACFEGRKALEIVRVLREVADRIESENVLTGRILDINGNSIGLFQKKEVII